MRTAATIRLRPADCHRPVTAAGRLYCKLRTCVGFALRIEPGDVVAIALKPSDDGQALIVRLFGASGEDRQAQLHWPTSSPRVWLSDLSENAIKPVEGAIPVAGWDVVTLRAEFHE